MCGTQIISPNISPHPLTYIVRLVHRTPTEKAAVFLPQRQVKKRNFERPKAAFFIPQNPCNQPSNIKPRSEHTSAPLGNYFDPFS